VRTELVLKGILPANHSFQGGDRLCLLPLGLFSSVEETHVSLQRKPTVLEAAASSTFFPCENRLRISMKYFLQLTCFKGEVGSFATNEPIQLRTQNTCISPKITMYVRIWIILYIVNL
jgi:hypothetical protein